MPHNDPLGFRIFWEQDIKPHWRRTIAAVAMIVGSLGAAVVGGEIFRRSSWLTWAILCASVLWPWLSRRVVRARVSNGMGIELIGRRMFVASGILAVLLFFNLERARDGIGVRVIEGYHVIVDEVDGDERGTRMARLLRASTTLGQIETVGLEWALLGICCGVLLLTYGATRARSTGAVG